MQACSKWNKTKADQPDIWESKFCELGCILLILSWSGSQTHKYRSKSDLDICDSLWSLNLWSMCYLHSHCRFCSVSDLPELSAPETGLGHFRNHVWVEYLVNTGRAKHSWAPDLYLIWGAHPTAVGGTEGEKSHHGCMCHRTEEAQSICSAMAILCLGILYVTALIPQKFWPVFYSRHKEQIMWFFSVSCIDPRSHRQRAK